MLVTVEEGSILRFGYHMLHYLTAEGVLDDGDIKVRNMVIPEGWIEAGIQYGQYEQAGLNAWHIWGTMLRLTERIDLPMLQV